MAAVEQWLWPPLLLPALPPRRSPPRQSTHTPYPRLNRTVCAPCAWLTAHLEALWQGPAMGWWETLPPDSAACTWATTTHRHRHNRHTHTRQAPQCRYRYSGKHVRLNRRPTIIKRGIPGYRHASARQCRCRQFCGHSGQRNNGCGKHISAGCVSVPDTGLGNVGGNHRGHIAVHKTQRKHRDVAGRQSQPPHVLGACIQLRHKQREGRVGGHLSRQHCTRRRHKLYDVGAEVNATEIQRRVPSHRQCTTSR